MFLRDMVKSLIIQEGFKPISPMWRFKHLTRMIPGHLLREMLQEFLPGGGPGADPGLVGEIMSLSLLGKTFGVLLEEMAREEEVRLFLLRLLSPQI